MAFFALCAFTFITFFQPGIVFPELDRYSLVFYSAIVAFSFYFIFGFKTSSPILSHKYSRYFFLFIAMQVLSSSALWLRAGWDTFYLWMYFVIIFFLIVKLCTDEKRIITIKLMIIFAILYLSYHSVSNVMINYQPGVRALGFGWYENPNDLVLILVSALPFTFSLVEYSKRFWVKLFFIAVAVLFSFNILLSGSREGLLGLLVVGGLIMLLSKGIPRKVRISLTIAMLVSIFTVGVATVMTRSDLGGGLVGDESSDNRLIQWKACMRMVMHNPFLGVGPGEAVYAMRDYGGIRGLVPHNTLVQVFAETGIPGGIFFFMCTCYPLWEALKFYRRNRDKLLQRSVMVYKNLVIALCGFWSCAIFSNRVYYTIVYVIIALIVAMQQNVLSEHDLVDNPDPRSA